MLLNDSIQITYYNNTVVTVKAGELVVLGDTALPYCVLGVAVSEINPGESGTLETSGIFSFDENDIKNVGLYQPVYCYKITGNRARFAVSPSDTFVYAGMSLTNRAVVGGPLILALGYNTPVYKAAASGSTSTPSNGEAEEMGNSSTTVDPSNSSEPGTM